MDACQMSGVAHGFGAKDSKFAASLLQLADVAVETAVGALLVKGEE